MGRRIPVVMETEQNYTPLEVAIYQLDKKTRQLAEEIEVVESTSAPNVQSLSMQLNGVIDAAVMGGVKKYEEAFFDGSYMAEFPEQKRLRPAFQRVLANQIPVLKKGMEFYEKYASETQAPHVEHLNAMLEKIGVKLLFVS
eukprot:TRINITY_DN5618_c0_g1_i1.p1 TRINITY_DN5618_c0_g1~~TRINITY_DN5618_c0_g1_i1.p1  ORF type:complete len:141 (-),score=27.61 TRINITY_DN5618_c0_g1_i1:20-442(-)